jgi:hypothetical protein
MPIGRMLWWATRFLNSNELGKVSDALRNLTLSDRFTYPINLDAGWVPPT